MGTGGLIIATGNVSGGNLTTAGELSVTGNANVGNLGTGGLIIATGNITGGNIIGTIAAGSNTISTTGNANIGNIGTTQLLASANITAPQLISNISIGTAPFVVTSTTQVANLSVATAGSATTAGTVTTNAQPNITSVGTLTSLAVTGNVTAGNVYANSGTIGANLLTGTLTTNAQPNVTSVGTLTNLVVTGNVTTGNVLLDGGLQSNRTNVSVTTNTVIDQFSPSTFRTAKYIISASSANGYQSVEALLVQDGTNSYITIYGSVCSNVVADIIEVSSNINGISGNVALYATSSGGTATVNLITTYLLT